MKHKQINKDKLIDTLIKKATGFYYKEELCEYEKTQNKTKYNINSASKYQNISFFDNVVTGNNDYNFDNDTIKTSNEKTKVLPDEINENLALTKKKITTHYVPPDLHSIKILFEILSREEIDDSLENLSDEELINLQNQLLKEIKSEDWKSFKFDF